jgi:formate dehydrogenase gamma subunit
MAELNFAVRLEMNFYSKQSFYNNLNYAIIGIFIIAFMTFNLNVAAAQEECLDCHGDDELTAVNDKGEEYSLYVDFETYKKSVHGDMDCYSCHSGITDLPHDENLPKVDCGTCHETEAEEYEWHGHLRTEDCVDAPCCADCHGKHNILHSDNKGSMTNPINLPETCGHCHENIDLVEKYDILMKHPVEMFENSIHGQASLGGIYFAATCNDCHSTGGTAHKILSPGFAQSTINHFNIPETCGKCHKNIEKDYWEGIHGKLVRRGVTDSPVCTSCHGEHGILSPDDPRSAVSPTRLAEATCSPCHESARLNEKYGVSTGRLRTWVDSYHGLKSKAGDITVANCASCHGAHRILPSSDPTSSVYKDNLQSTCGNCHPGISEAVAKTPIHGDPGLGGTPIAGIIKNIYIFIIFVIIGAMVLHWLIDLRKELKSVTEKNQIRRMNLNEVWQHAFLTTTFIVLVITGFSLRFSDAWWVKFLFAHEGGFPLRGIIHRVAAVLFIITALWHLFYLNSRRGRQFLKDMLPAKTDFIHLKELVTYNIGIGKTKPRFGRFSYVEKAEYWALVWGAIVMVVTGLFLWFDNYAVKILPKGVLDVMLVIHYYEAWLATLAVLIWHFYAVIFNPAAYPMNPSWLTGKMPVDLYRHEHPADISVFSDSEPVVRKEPEKSRQLKD